MQAGNAHYLTGGDIPAVAPVFPLAGALLLPTARLPLNVFEPRYTEMVDTVLGGNRLIGMIQPALDGRVRADGEPELCEVGCLGRITSITETGDGRYVMALDGVCRFRVAEEIASKLPFRQCRITPFLTDLDMQREGSEVDRAGLLKALRDYVKANGFQIDWDSIQKADNATLVNALSIMAPYGPAEKQALLEAADLKSRSEMLVAMAEIELARERDGFPSGLQ